ncbi:transcriptional regulator [Mesorhizobium sp. WSM4312]|uniref:ArsR/SmtB family transcription factor n=1 Tax=Mesorhizobium sp. WSM4312 TaxID=2029411 RepID=UPI000BAF4A7B|nr:metalloregulator ArsR/SmtB family transcription factor [Mesorhizobium sp. WSM4312]PBB66263.1 transcriptional regulator [Mesorhizobium sp. WSM4312]
MRNIKIADLDKQAREASELLAAMANEKRLMILCHLLDGETSVNELAELVAMNQSALSQQLSKLRALKLVDTRRDAQQVYYRLASVEVERILQTLYGIYCDPQTRIARVGSR